MSPPHNWDETAASTSQRTSPGQRAHLAGLMDVLVAHEPQVHYDQVRPMTTRSILTPAALRAHLKAGLPLTMDCSESVTLLCRLAGLDDPNGLGYNGLGFTGTLLSHLPHYSKPENAMTGALVVFGTGTGHHVCMVRKPGKNPLLFSHGQERGPIYISLSAEREFQPKPVTFLSVAGL